MSRRLGIEPPYVEQHRPEAAADDVLLLRKKSRKIVAGIFQRAAADGDGEAHLAGARRDAQMIEETGEIGIGGFVVDDEARIDGDGAVRPRNLDRVAVPAGMAALFEHRHIMREREQPGRRKTSDAGAENSNFQARVQRIGHKRRLSRSGSMRRRRHGRLRSCLVYAWSKRSDHRRRQFSPAGESDPMSPMVRRRGYDWSRLSQFSPVARPRRRAWTGSAQIRPVSVGAGPAICRRGKPASSSRASPQVTTGRPSRRCSLILSAREGLAAARRRLAGRRRGSGAGDAAARLAQGRRLRSCGGGAVDMDFRHRPEPAHRPAARRAPGRRMRSRSERRTRRPADGEAVAILQERGARLRAALAALSPIRRGSSSFSISKSIRIRKSRGCWTCRSER